LENETLLYFIELMLTNKAINLIRTITLELRQQILSGEIKFFGSEIFPCACCGSASRYLEGRLANFGFEELEYVCKSKNGQSHAWLEYKGYIIDITADQFPEMKNHPIIIIKKVESEFHKQFT
jgi:hypothetical protein